MTNPSDPNGPYGPQPGYGAPPPGPQPGFGAPPPGYGGPPPGYGPPPAGYGAPGGAPAPGYGAPPPGYGAPAPGYGAPPPGYGTPPPGYGAPAPGSVAGQPPVGTPPPGAGYPPPGPGYGPPQPGFGPSAYASWGLRVGGYLIDALIAGVPFAIFYILAMTVGTESVDCSFDESSYSSYSSYTCDGGGMSAVGVIMMLLAIVLGLAATLYLAYMEGTTGQTPGKKVVGIRLIREADGQVLGFGMAFVRKLCHILDGAACYIGFLWPLWDDKRQTFADKIISTVVVPAPK